MGTLSHDIRFAIRTLRRSPGYTAAALVTLVLGIGATTAVFSVVHGIVLAPLPFAEPDRLVDVREVSGRGHAMDAAWRNFADWRAGARGFTSLAAYTSGGTLTVLGAGEPLRLEVSSVSDGFLRTLGVTPALGRDFLSEEHAAGADAALIVSHGFWRTHLGGDADLSAHRLNVGGHDARIVGVAPPEFDHPEGVDVWYPLELNEPNDSRTSHNYDVVGRLAPGVDMAAAAAELDAITRGFIEEDPGVVEEEGFADFFPRSVAVRPLREALVGDTRRPLWILLGASLLVLLVACTNLASATLARGTGREQEYAVRRSLGAGRAVVVRQLFTESVVLALAAGALAVAFAGAALRVLPAVAPTGIPRIDDVGLNPAVLAVAFGLSALTAVLFGLLPALRVAEADLAGLLRGGGRGGIDRGRHRVWKALIAFEVALALVLLAGSGLLLRSFASVLQVQPGYRTTGLLVATVTPPQARYADGAARGGYYEALRRALAQLPGVAEVGLVSSAPMASVANGLVEVRGGPAPTTSGEYQLVDQGYFGALDIPVLRGRTFDGRDRADAPHVVVVNRSFAEAAWPGEDPIGRQMTAGGMDDYWDQEKFATVIGVVADVRQRDLTAEPGPTYYFPLSQRPFRSWSMNALVRPERGSPLALAGPLRAAVRAVDPDVPVTIGTIEARLSDALTPRRFTMLVLAAFAGVALLLACVGIWGVVAYATARRTREIGIRIALGADPASVRRLVQRDYLLPAAGGVVAGLALAFVAARVLRSLLFGVQPTDPATFIAVAACLIAAAWAASFVPAFRGTRVAPGETMRAE